MAKINGFRKILINTGIILFFIFLAYAYLFPLLEGKSIGQPDIEHWKGMSKELIDYRQETGEEALWTNRMFGGMPSFMISTKYSGNVTKYVHNPIRDLFHPAAIIILYLIGFYVLLTSFGIKRWLSVCGAIAFGFSSYFIIIIEAGHNTKAYAIGYLSLVLAGVLLAYRKKTIAGALLFTASLSLILLANHLQITYYGLLMVLLYVIIKFIYAIRENEVPHFLKASLMLAAGAIIAVGMNFSRLYSTWEYSGETIRGPSELTSGSENKTTGLDKDYVVQWSYGIDETLTLLIPRFKGGASTTNPGVDSETYKVMQQRGVQNVRQNIQGVSMYHGKQPGTSGPVYGGAIVVFLFFLGLFIVKGPVKWWLLIATVVSIVLSWGGNIMWLTSFLLDYLPLYNKFRAPSMTLVIANFTMPLLGFIALNKIITGQVEKKEWLNGLKWSVIITGGISILFAVLPGLAGNFTSPADAARYPDWLMESIIADRKDLLQSDAFRSFLFIILAAGALYLWHIQKLKTNAFVIILGALILIDMWTVDKRYLNNENFVRERQAENPFPLMPADREILKDEDLYFRVLPLQNPWQDARASYYHHNIGGYHAAKLRRYQDLITYHLQPELQQMVQRLQSGVSTMDSVFQSLEAINMMNTRYVIYDLNNNPLYNPLALGNAWFVDNYRLVENADEEIQALNTFDPKTTAIVDNRFGEFVQGKSFSKDESGSINLTDYEPNYLKYNYKADSEQLTVFSDIYYDKGWNAYIDGEKVPHFRVNYVLRAMVIPEGEHVVEFKFEPQSYYMGTSVSLASSILFILFVLGYGFYEFRKKRYQPNSAEKS